VNSATPQAAPDRWPLDAVLGSRSAPTERLRLPAPAVDELAG
jgi:hypothetical protein